MRDVRICFIGDSFVNGTGDDDCLGWVGRIAATARRAGSDLTVYNLGIRRDTSRDIANRWAAEAERRLPSGVDGRLLFSFGVNDCVLEHGQPRVPLAESLANAEQILRRAVVSWPVAMIGPPPIDDDGINGRTRALSAALADLCAGLAVPFLSCWDHLAANQTWRHEVAAGDGAHPNHAGYRVLADYIAAWPVWQRWALGGS